MTTFWIWLTKFAFRFVRQSVPYHQLPDGVPGIRSIDSPCPAYAPRPYILGDWADCQGDGHYLCRKCAHREGRQCGRSSRSSTH